jgi:branched-chain amino acid transport system permease protein
MIEYIYSLITIALIWTILAQSYNLSFGLAGLFNLGHVIFYGIGAYAAAILNTRYGIGFGPNILFSAVIAGAAASIFGLLTLRLRGHYLAIATLGAAMIAQVVALNWMSLTRGPLGIRGIDEVSLFGASFIGDTLPHVLLYICITGIVLFLLWKLFHSPWGRLLRAIRDDETAVQAVGKNVFVAKLWALVLSAAFAGVAGALYTHYRLFLDPSIFALPEIILLILIVIVGGRGKYWGVIGGAVLIILIGEVPRFLDFPDAMIGAARNITYAALLMATMFWRPNGIFSSERASQKNNLPIS